MSSSGKVDLFGWDLLFKITQPQIQNNFEKDLLILLCHWKLIRNDFKCAGIGEDLTNPTPEELSETLPNGWNLGSKYNIRYYYNGKLYILNGTFTEGILIVNFNRICDNKATGVSLTPNVVQDKSGNLEKMIPSYENVITKIQKELIDPMLKDQPSKEISTQTPAQNTTPPSSNPLLVNPRRSETYLPSRDLNPPFGHEPLRPFPTPLGRSDLDPFAPPGGGMLFQPPGFGPRLPGPIDPMMPPGAVPPGARFDPFRPLGSGGRNQGHPDHDHLPPPGYDDMFM